MKTPHRCPICGGNGKVPAGFYNQTSGDWITTSTEPETCLSCNGTGIVWEYQEGGLVGGNKNNEILNT